MSIARCAGLAVAVVVTLTVLPVLTGGPAPAQITWNLPSAYPAANFHTQNLDAFARDLAQVTNGKLAIRVYPNASLLPAPATPPPTPLMLLGDLSVTGNGDLPLATQR